MSAPRAKQLGVTDDDYRRLLEAQDGHCALCSSVPKTRRLDVDHDHRTMRVRGLLCHRCNRALPSWISIPWLLRAVGYLFHPPADAFAVGNRPSAVDGDTAPVVVSRPMQAAQRARREAVFPASETGR